MKNFTREPWLELRNTCENDAEDPETRTAAALALQTLYRYILDKLKTKRVGDGVPKAPERIDNVDKKDLST